MAMFRIRAALVCLLLSMGVNAAMAASFYVSTAGSDANPGTLASPFLTIAKGARLLIGGEWLEFTVEVSALGSSVIAIPVSLTAAGATMHVSFNGVNKTGAIVAPNTGSWDVNQTVSKVNLSAGTQVMQAVFDTNGSSGYTCGIGDIAFAFSPTGNG